MPWLIFTSCHHVQLYAVEPLKKEQLGIMFLVHYSEVICFEVDRFISYCTRPIMQFIYSLLYVHSCAQFNSFRVLPKVVKRVGETSFVMQVLFHVVVTGRC